MSDADLSSLIKNLDAHMHKSFEAFLQNISSVRSGKPASSAVDGILVDCYGSAMPINQLALVSVPDTQTILIEPWDKTLLSAISRAIMVADVGFVPQIDGQLIRIVVPPLSEERREEFVKLVRKMAEEARVSVRAVRRQFNESAKKMLKDKLIGEDQERTLGEKIQKQTNFFVKKIDDFLKEKEEILKQI